jgi:hypothetical protein
MFKRTLPDSNRFARGFLIAGFLIGVVSAGGED